MTTFRVWGPGKRQVEVMCCGERLAMRPEAGGWWSIEVSRAQPGSDYAFVLDDEDPLPDPRSAWQPCGVHGASRVVDHGAFAWTDRGWQAPPLSAAVLYELHVGTFTPDGTFAAVIDHLEHLVDLGVTHIEIMPVNEFSGSRGWGYDGVQLYAPHHAYGGPDGLKLLIDRCHARGLAVILDVVYNHLGPVGNSLARFAPYFTDRYSTPWGHAVNLDDAESHEVRRFICDNAVSWLRDYHCDGLRLDAVHALFDQSAVHLLEQLAAEVAALEAQLGRHLVLIAESALNDPRVVRPQEVGGYGIDAQWNDDFHHALHTVLTGERTGYYADFGMLSALTAAFEKGFVYAGQYSAFRRRLHGRPALGVSGHQFVGFMQNHDQIGNRARGERSSALLNPARLKVAAALVLLGPFVPLLFQGEEWGASTPFQYFTDHADPDLGRQVREGRQQEFSAFGWNAADIPDPQALQTFVDSRLNWKELQHEPHTALLDWHRELIRLRRRLPALSDGRFDLVRARCSEEEGWLTVTRGPITMACNVSADRRHLKLPNPLPQTLLLASEPTARLVDCGIDVPPESVAIVA